MNKAIDGLTTRLIDYAGLFPPAGLSMKDALATYCGHLGEAESAMLARFICPASRLGELGELRASWPADGLELCLLGAPESTIPAWLARSATDIASARAFVEAFPATRITAFEVKLPAEALGATDIAEAVSRCVEGLGESLAKEGFKGLHVLCEARFVDTDRAFFDAVVKGLRVQQRCGLKVRCGGLDESSFPSSRRLAQALLAARDGDCELKATAGLHHPLRHLDSQTGWLHHGFLNLTCAAVFALAFKLDEERVVEILEECSPEAFTFSRFAAHWRELDADLEAISSARRQLFAGFGSCSFSQPVDDLRALRLLPNPSQS